MFCIGILLMFCEPQAPVPSQSSAYCDLYKPVCWSKNDTRITKEQADSNNRVWRKLCPNKPNPCRGS